jgi:hypothetical protein
MQVLISEDNHKVTGVLVGGGKSEDARFRNILALLDKFMFLTVYSVCMTKLLLKLSANKSSLVQ